MKATLKSLIILLFVIQCVNREHKNPLDPKNPDTYGKPGGLNVFSEYDNITLSWRSINVKNLIGYNIYRKISGESSFSFIHLTPPDSTTFFDRNVTYNLKYTYKISVLTSGYESPLSDSVNITPGPTNIWVTDVDNHRIIKITHDGLHEIERLSVDGNPWDIAIDPQDRSIWYSDILWGEIYQLMDNSWKRFTSPTSWWRPIDIAFDDVRKILWVADDRGKVVRISQTTADSVLEIVNNDFVMPYSVAIDKQTGKCWVADPLSKNVFNISNNGQIVENANAVFIRPVSVSVNQTDGSCWVADSSRIVKLLKDGTLSFSTETGLLYAYTLDVNKNTGETWVGDYGNTYNDARLIKFDAQGNKLLQVTGFNYPGKIAVNLHDNGCVVVDTGNGRIVRLSSEGDILSEIGGYYYPQGIVVEYSGDSQRSKVQFFSHRDTEITEETRRKISP